MLRRLGSANREARTAGTIGFLKVFGVPLRLHFTSVLLLIFLISVGLSGKQSPWSGLLFVAALFASVVMHEAGHALVSHRFGIRTLDVVMYPIGGIARLEKSPKPHEDFWIALAGPLVNLGIAGLLVAWLAWSGRLVPVSALIPPTDANLLGRIAASNVILAAFNLLPAFPMDGGRLLRSLLARWKPEHEATRIATAAGRFLGISMGLYGLLTMQFMLVFVAFFVYLGAAQESLAAMGRNLTQGVPVREAMVSEFHTLQHGQTIGDAARLLLATSQQDFPVVHGAEVMGLLGRNALLRAMATEGPEAYVAGWMDRDFLRLDPDADLADMLPQLAHSGACALVMEGARLAGLLTAENLSEYLVLRRVGMTPSAVRQA